MNTYFKDEKQENMNLNSCLNKSDGNSFIASSSMLLSNDSCFFDQNRMKNWIIEQEYYSKFDAIKHRLTSNDTDDKQTSNSVRNKVNELIRVNEINIDNNNANTHNHNHNNNNNNINNININNNNDESNKNSIIMKDSSETEIKIQSNRSSRKRRDLLSHRIIEKKRRDRMNTCLQDLKGLIPMEFLKKSRNRIEKTEIVEMTIDYLKKISKNQGDNKTNETEYYNNLFQYECKKQYEIGYQECISECIRYLMNETDHETNINENICYRLSVHLQKRLDKLLKNSKDVLLENGIENKNNNIDDNKSNKMDDSEFKHDENNEERCKQKVNEESNEIIHNAQRLISVNNQAQYKFKEEIKKRFQSNNSQQQRNYFCNYNYCRQPQSNEENFKNIYSEQLSISATHSSLSGSTSGSNGSTNKSNYTDRSFHSKDHNKYQRSVNIESNSSEELTQNKTAPGFVLHPNGTYYIPIKVNKSSLNNLCNQDLFSSFCLHPISISVDFCNQFPSVIDKITSFT